jgi:hypothetical protein
MKSHPKLLEVAESPERKLRAFVFFEAELPMFSVRIISKSSNELRLCGIHAQTECEGSSLKCKS